MYGKGDSFLNFHQSMQHKDKTYIMGDMCLHEVDFEKNSIKRHNFKGARSAANPGAQERYDEMVKKLEEQEKLLEQQNNN